MNIFSFIKNLLKDNLTQGQRLALARYNASLQSRMKGMHDALKTQTYQRIDTRGIEYTMHRWREEADYMEWFIRNHPELINEDGTGKNQIIEWEEK